MLRHPYYLSAREEQREEARERYREEAFQYLDEIRPLTGRVLEPVQAGRVLEPVQAGRVLEPVQAGTLGYPT